MPAQTINQSTNHIMLIEPAEFYLNPETRETNVYQLDEHESREKTFEKALREFRDFQALLIENGIAVTTMRGAEGCPDHLFPNWASSHENGGDRRMVLYPMMNENRRAERTPAIIDLMERTYRIELDLRDRELGGHYLEATGSLCLDRMNKVAYAARSPRTDEGLAREWGAAMGYDIELFDTRSHTGKPIYHTDLVMFIGTDVAALCKDCIIGNDAQERIAARLAASGRELVELSLAQQQAFCGNALEVIGEDGKPFLVMSSRAYEALDAAQKEIFGRYFERILHSPLHTIETYGGGSARCLMMELF